MVNATKLKLGKEYKYAELCELFWIDGGIVCVNVYGWLSEA